MKAARHVQLEGALPMRARMNGRLEPCTIRYPRPDTLHRPTWKVGEVLHHAASVDLIEEAAQLFGCGWNCRRHGPDAAASVPRVCAIGVHGARSRIHVQRLGSMGC